MHKLELLPVYMVLGSSFEERKLFIQKVIERVQDEYKSCACFTYKAKETPLKEILSSLEVRDLFASHTLVVVEHLEKLTKQEGESLAEYTAHPASFATLVLAGDTSSFVIKNKKGLLDYRTEKPWEKQERLQAHMLAFFNKEGKKIAPDALACFLERVESDLATLEKEGEKLICFAGERTDLSLKDVHAVIALPEEKFSWQLAEKIVWKKRVSPPSFAEDPTLIFPLITQLRRHMQVGHQLIELLKESKTHEEILSYLPSLKPKQLSFYISVAQTCTPSLFQEGLKLLFALEYGIKSSSAPIEALFDRFFFTFEKLK